MNSGFDFAPTADMSLEDLENQFRPMIAFLTEFDTFEDFTSKREDALDGMKFTRSSNAISDGFMDKPDREDYDTGEKDESGNAIIIKKLVEHEEDDYPVFYSISKIRLGLDAIEIENGVDLSPIKIDVSFTYDSDEKRWKDAIHFDNGSTPKPVAKAAKAAGSGNGGNGGSWIMNCWKDLPKSSTTVQRIMLKMCANAGKPIHDLTDQTVKKTHQPLLEGEVRSAYSIPITVDLSGNGAIEYLIAHYDAAKESGAKF